MSSSIPVLTYHHVAPDREVTPEGFERQLRWLSERGYRSLSSSELLDHLSGRRPAGGKAVALTFDDGYADNWVYAYPALRRHGFRAQVFVVTSRIGEGPRRLNAEEGGALVDTRSAERAAPGFLTWAELKAMAGDVFEIGSHTHSHRNFIRERPYEDIDEELSRSRAEIEARTGGWNGALAWPWGDFEEAWLGRLPAAGYRLAYTAKPGSNAPGTGPWRVRRFKVQNDCTRWLARRLWVHGSDRLAALYGAVYGLV